MINLEVTGFNQKSDVIVRLIILKRPWLCVGMFVSAAFFSGVFGVFWWGGAVCVCVPVCVDKM